MDEETLKLLTQMYETCKLLREWQQPLYNKVNGKEICNLKDLNLLEQGLKKTLDYYNKTGTYSPFYDPEEAARMAQHMTFGDPRKAMELINKKSAEKLKEVAKGTLSKWDIQWLALQQSRKNFSVMLTSLGGLGGTGGVGIGGLGGFSGIGSGLIGLAGILGTAAIAEAMEDDPPATPTPGTPTPQPTPEQLEQQRLLAGYFGYLISWVTTAMSVVKANGGSYSGVSQPLTFSEWQGKQAKSR